MPVISPDPLTASLKELCDTSAADISTLYSVHDVLGEGRFSRVYAAVDVRNGQVLALKELDMSAIAEDEEAFDMLKAEVLALRRAGNALGQPTCNAQARGRCFVDSTVTQ